MHRMARLNLKREGTKRNACRRLLMMLFHPTHPLDSAVDEPNVTQKEIFSDMLRHMMAPLVIGMVFGGIWQLTVMPRIDTFVPNPVHGAFAICLITSPLDLQTTRGYGNEPCR